MENYWQEFRFGVDTPDDVVARVVKLWSIDKDEVGILWDPPWNWVRWEGGFDFASSTSQTAMFDTAARISCISLSTGGGGNPQCLRWPRCSTAWALPTTIQCPCGIGGSSSISGFCWLFVQGSFNLDQEEVPTIQPETLMGNTATHALRGDFIAVAPTGDISQMAYVYGTGLQAWELCLLRPWPGSIEAIEILPFEEYLRCANSREAEVTHGILRDCDGWSDETNMS